jgi:hypothetical protein
MSRHRSYLHNRIPPVVLTRLDHQYDVKEISLFCFYCVRITKQVELTRLGHAYERISYCSLHQKQQYHNMWDEALGRSSATRLVLKERP